MTAETKEIVEYVLKALGYLAAIIIPVVVLILGFMFRTPLTHVLMNMKRWKFPWGEVETKDSPPQVAQESLEKSITEEKVLIPPTLGAPPTGPSPSPTPATAVAKQPAPEMVEEHAKLMEIIRNRAPLDKLVGQEREDFIIFVLAERILALSFERTYRAIFGSQMEALMLANRPSGVPVDGLRDLFNNAKERFPKVHSNRTLEEWIAYMVSDGLIETVPNNDKLYRTKPYGKGFLHYVIAEGLQVKYAEFA